jgi:predicted GIY-YIG superfamily endonuclease
VKHGFLLVEVYMFYVYAIESIKTGRIYIGQTKDIEIRLRIHNKRQVNSTAKEVPWTIIAFEKFDTRDQARWCEKNLKKSRGKRLKWLNIHQI